MTVAAQVTVEAPAVPARRHVTVPQLRARGRVRFLAGLLGPAFVASVAYVDPGNFATNFAGGAARGYALCGSSSSPT